MCDMHKLFSLFKKSKNLTVYEIQIFIFIFLLEN